jgi:hypothetical protein
MTAYYRVERTEYAEIAVDVPALLAEWAEDRAASDETARSSAVTITNAAGESRTVSAWALEYQRRRNRRKRRSST